MTDIVLASQSASRRAMLTAAGVSFRAESPGVDEEAAKASLVGLSGRDLADALAELKAVKLSLRHPQAIVLGCDSTVETADGALLDKAESRVDAEAQLKGLRGTTHRLSSAIVAAQGGQPIWRHVDVAKMTMRDFSDDFLQSYLGAEWPAIGGCVGGYRIEGLGAQLFAKIEGSQFTIMGLPLLPLLAWLRDRGALPA
ncbi:septum formation protein [Sphingomonas vulcanisoli]|uniref:Nucleoside triphosphate pyrophosphatase n=1 Tax=Sphingomonas vulcanisoli TaxID=1658060 RepID=A0ABX0TT28_9SPHN|nr:septum formation protein [Sphingomonas vulcanisoli]